MEINNESAAQIAKSIEALRKYARSAFPNVEIYFEVESTPGVISLRMRHHRLAGGRDWIVLVPLNERVRLQIHDEMGRPCTREETIELSTDRVLFTYKGAVFCAVLNGLVENPKEK